MYKAVEEMSSRSPRLDPDVGKRLLRVCARVRRSLTLEGLATLAAFLLLAALGQSALDHLAHGLRWSMRAALLGVSLMVAGWVLWRTMIQPLRVRFGEADVAHLLERRYPHLSSVLVSAVRFASGQVGPAESNSPALVASVIDQAGHRVRGLDFDAVIRPSRLRWSILAVLVVASLAGGAAYFAPEITRLWWERSVLLRDVPWPKQTKLVVEIPDRTIVGARGDDLLISAHAEGVQPREVEIFYRTASGRRGRQSMVTVGSEGTYRYRYSFEKAEEDFTFHLRGGDDETEVYQARLLERPKVVRTEIQIVPPEYTRLPSSLLGDGQRSAQVLRGSQVTLRAATNHPVFKAVLMAGDEVAAEASLGDRMIAALLTPVETRTYFFRLQDETGLENREVVRFAVQVIKDEAPRARLKIPGVGDMITPEAVLPLEMEFEDAYGLALAELVIQVTREEAREQTTTPAGFEPGTLKHTASLSWAAASAGVQPGERLTLTVRARDFDSVTGPNEGRSPEINLRVVTKDELLAELARREQRHRDDFERIVDLQEQTRSRLLSLIGLSTESGTDGAAAESAASLERTQRNLGGSVNVIRQQFERILRELEINQLNTAATQERLGEKIVEPLTGLVRRDLAVAADTIRQFASAASRDLAERIDTQQVAILSQMRSVLANMIHQAGYQEVINMLREIIRLQEDLKKETQKALEEQAEGVFDK